MGGAAPIISAVATIASAASGGGLLGGKPSMPSAPTAAPASGSERVDVAELNASADRRRAKRTSRTGLLALGSDDSTKTTLG